MQRSAQFTQQRVRIVLLGLMLGGATAQTASAALIDETVSFGANVFNVINSIPAPVSPVTGSFTIALDTTQTYTAATAGITGSINISVGSPLSFDYDPTTGLLVVGGLDRGAGIIGITPASNDFYLQINNFATAPTIRQFGYAQASIPNGYYYTSVNDPAATSLTVAPVVSAVPAPAMWPVLAISCLGMGLIFGRTGAGRTTAA